MPKRRSTSTSQCSAKPNDGCTSRKNGSRPVQTRFACWPQLMFSWYGEDAAKADAGQHRDAELILVQQRRLAQLGELLGRAIEDGRRVGRSRRGRGGGRVGRGRRLRRGSGRGRGRGRRGARAAPAPRRRRARARTRRARSPPGEPSPRHACSRQSIRKHRAGEEGERPRRRTGGIAMTGGGRSSRRGFLHAVGRLAGAAPWRRRSCSRRPRPALGDRRPLAVPVRAPRDTGAPRPAADRAAPPGLGGGPPHQRDDRVRPDRDPAVRSQPVPLPVPGAVGRSPLRAAVGGGHRAPAPPHHLRRLPADRFGRGARRRRLRRIGAPAAGPDAARRAADPHPRQPRAVEVVLRAAQRARDGSSRRRCWRASSATAGWRSSTRRTISAARSRATASAAGSTR